MPPPAEKGPAAKDPAACDNTVVIPEIEEVAEVTTRMVDTGVVRITKHVHDVEKTFQPELHDERVRVEHVPVNRIVKNPPEIRTQGNTTIIPVVEEVMVKLILLKEELHVIRESVDKPASPQHVTLRREEIKVDRTPATQAPASPAGPASPPNPRS